MSTIAESLSPPARFDLMPRLALAGVIAALGDWLFFERPLGASVALFLTAIAAGAAVANRGSAGRREQLLATAVLGLALLPLVEALGPVSLLFGVAGTALFAVVAAGAWPGGVRGTVTAALGVVVAGPFQLVPDLAAGWRAAKPPAPRAVPGSTPRLDRAHAVLRRVRGAVRVGQPADR